MEDWKMARDNFFSGLSSAFWGLTFAMIGFALFVASVGGNDLVRLFLAATAAYSILGMAWGGWAARKAVMRSKAR